MMNYKQIRKDLGLNLSQMAATLGLEGKNRSDYVRKIESGASEPSGPINKLYEFLGA